MDKNELKYEDFLNDVNPMYVEAVNDINDYLLQNGCKAKIELAKNGYLVSYSHAKSKKVIVNFVFRKNGLIIRIYGDFVGKYIDFMETLPDQMIISIDKSPACKRLIDPTKCNSRCSMGYDFSIKGNRYQKCRYNCFMFEVNEESIPYIKVFLKNEIEKRTA